MTFHNADTGFAVLKVKARGRRDLVPARRARSFDFRRRVYPRRWGLADGPNARSSVQGGHAEDHAADDDRGHGSLSRLRHGPWDRSKLAERIVGQFGLGTFEIIEADPSRLREVSGIGEFRAGKIAAGWAEQKAVRDIMVFLHGHGVSTSRAVRIFKTYGHDAIAVMTDDPYRLARDIRGIGFRSADVIAMRLGLTKESPKRLRAGVSFALQTATDEGHCALPVDELLKLAEKLLEVPAEPIQAAIDAELADGKVVLDRIENQPCLFLKGLHSAERDIAERLKSLNRGDLPWPTIEAERAIPWVEERTGKTLAPSQRAAVHLVLRSKVSVITGGPGVGKTTLLNTILRILTAKGVRLLLAAPTGRAAKRMSEQTGIEAKTIHRLLEIDPKNGGFRKGPNDPLDCDLLVIDETSMVDVPLMNAITKAIRPRSGLLLVGDVDQLPSVGPGRVLADVIESRRHRGRPPDRGFSSGRRKPHRRQRSPHQPGRDAGMAKTGQQLRLLLRRVQRSRGRCRKGG